MGQEYSVLHIWFDCILEITKQHFHMKVSGCSAYMYLRDQAAVCCALIYGRRMGKWQEFATRRVFSINEIPEKIIQNVNAKQDNDISKEFLAVLLEQQKGNKEMKNGASKLFQTALGIAAKGDSIADTLRYRKDSRNQVDSASRVAELAKAVLNQNWFDVANIGFKAIIDMISEDPLSYSEFLSVISQYVDAKIIHIEQEENLCFVGGECRFEVDEGLQVVHTNIQLYFKNQNKAWIKKELNGKTGFDVFCDEALTGDIYQILREGGRKFPITAPKKE